MEELKKLYKKVRGHDYRHLRLKEDELDYYELLNKLWETWKGCVWEDRESIPYKFYYHISHDTNTELWRALRFLRAGKTIDSYMHMLSELLLTMIHTYIDTGTVKVAYTWYGGANPLSDKLRLSRFEYREGGIVRVFKESEIPIIVESIENKIKELKEYVKSNPDSDFSMKRLENSEAYLKVLKSGKRTIKSEK